MLNMLALLQMDPVAALNTNALLLRSAFLRSRSLNDIDDTASNDLTKLRPRV